MGPLIQVKRYQAEDKDAWDAFVKKAKNGHFLFFRDYMEYHCDRFEDHSLLFYRDQDLLAILPANKEGNQLSSHGGLTFGGLLVEDRAKTPLVLEVFDALCEELKQLGFESILYKPIPHIYHRQPAEEDLYALFLLKAELIRRDISSTIRLNGKIPFAKNRRGSIKKSKEASLELKQSNDFKTFIAIEAPTLEKKYQTKPTHTGDELHLLAQKFPENIKLHGAFENGRMLAGAVTYESETAVHTQYMAANERGKEVGALDRILEDLIEREFSKKRYFNFGISNEREGLYLNPGLTAYKESYGARGIIFDRYRIDLNKVPKNHCQKSMQ